MRSINLSLLKFEKFIWMLLKPTTTMTSVDSLKKRDLIQTKLIKKLKKRNDKLKTKMEAIQMVNCFYASQWKGLKISQDISISMGLGKETGNEVWVAQIATEFINLQKQIKQLKE